MVEENRGLVLWGTIKSVEGRPNLRETKQNRSEVTQQKILNAAIEIVCEQGFAHATLNMIAKRAEITRGAIQHLYGGKRIDLFEHVAVELYTRYVISFAPLNERATDPVSFVNTLWDVIEDNLDDPEWLALIDLWMAMRSDADLKQALGRAFADMDAVLEAEWRATGQQLGIDEEILFTIRFFHRSLMRGLVIENQVGTNAAHIKSVLTLARKACLACLSSEKAMKL